MRGLASPGVPSAAAFEVGLPGWGEGSFCTTPRPVGGLLPDPPGLLQDQMLHSLLCATTLKRLKRLLWHLSYPVSQFSSLNCNFCGDRDCFIFLSLAPLPGWKGVEGGSKQDMMELSRI